MIKKGDKILHVTERDGIAIYGNYENCFIMEKKWRKSGFLEAVVPRESKE